MLDVFFQYLPTIIAGLLITPLTIYIKNRVKNLATKHDFDIAIEQLETSTSAVESIKNQFNEKHWVKQQVWDTKRIAYEDIISCLYLTKKYIDQLSSYLNEYIECHTIASPCSYGGIHDKEAEREIALYRENKQKMLKENFESKAAHEGRRQLRLDTNESILGLESVFTIKSMYLHPDLEVVESFLSELKAKVFNDEPSQSRYEDNADYYDGLLDHYSLCENLVVKLITKTKNIASIDLKLDA